MNNYYYKIVNTYRAKTYCNSNKTDNYAKEISCLRNRIGFCFIRIDSALIMSCTCYYFKNM